MTIDNQACAAERAGAVPAEENTHARGRVRRTVNTGLPPLSPPLAPNSPTFAAAALAAAAEAHHAPAMLIRGGPMQRAQRLIDLGHEVAEAADIAAKQGKGHVAELHQSASYTSLTAALLGAHSARPNPRANDAVIDVQVRRGRRVSGGVQIKVGSPGYVKRAAGRSRARALVVNTEAFAVVERELPMGTGVQLTHGGSSAARLSGEHCHRVAANAIEHTLGERVGEFALLVGAARAGMHSGFETACFAMLSDLLDALVSGRSLDLRASIDRALAQAARSAARGTLHSYLLVDRFRTAVGTRFCDRLLRRIARSTIVVGVIADVLVETAVDLYAVHAGRLTLSDILPRFGVHVTTAAGGGLGLALGLLLFASAGGWVQLLAGALGAGLGATAGRCLGEALFLADARSRLGLVVVRS